MKSIGMFSGYCEELRRLLDKMDDKEYGKFNSSESNRNLINYIGYKRKESEHHGSKNQCE